LSPEISLLTFYGVTFSCGLFRKNEPLLYAVCFCHALILSVLMPDRHLLFIRECLFLKALMLLRGFRKKGGKNQNEVELMDAYENKH